MDRSANSLHEAGMRGVERQWQLPETLWPHQPKKQMVIRDRLDPINSERA